MDTLKNSSAQVWNFVSAPALHPMKVTINVNKPGTASGLLFVAPYTSYEATMIGQTGALIMDQAGNPVWFRSLDSIYKQNTNFRVQSYQGEPVLTMWQGTASGTQSVKPDLPLGTPEPGAYYLIINQNYKVIKELTARKGYTADIHEFTITARNTALFTAVKQVPADLTPYGGPEDGYFNDYSIQEVDLTTGQLLFFWNALAHVDPADSMAAAFSARIANNIWDCFHVNSVEEGANNTLLISMRNMWAIYNVDKETGNIIWQLGGKQNDFVFGPEAAFAWQHNARHRPGNRISLFDNACCSLISPPKGPAHGLILRLDFRNMTANVDRAYYHDPNLIVPSQGNVQKLPNGNQFVGWGQRPYLSEFANAGNTEKDSFLNFLYDMQFPNRNMSYRAFKNEWVGLPFYPPSIAVEPSYEASAIVYASWNGSTETVAWQILAGPTPYKLSVVINSTPRTGFETKIEVTLPGPYFRVNALNSSGQIIGISRIAHVYEDRTVLS
ncbi:arylsulfotransferase (asst) [Lucifera butyrica]|uniref:Arylsulfotransferase (Asst) n=1 Tax=Lucifera butyrica TaxID=1351585 RepID=A0A498R9H0_9FIRM|nr:arylsulfotransferase family protein [Lucifera butyrica]VBB05778.1 arylsulfotransferase (asst) [Lucifera butyrica]